MSLLDEEWKPELHGNACDCPSSIELEGDPIFYANDESRAYFFHKRVKLAALAPKMAKLLLLLESGEHSRCPSGCDVRELCDQIRKIIENEHY